ncbi:hypothetical protein C3492_35490 [Streptomyces sp. Ru62]|nr:hypothetical protein C3492_35490 [Streptomyces sp. Ru62]
MSCSASRPCVSADSTRTCQAASSEATRTEPTRVGTQLNDACDGPRDGVPAVIWRVVALAATSAGDVGITYAPPAH